MMERTVLNSTLACALLAAAAVANRTADAAEMSAGQQAVKTAAEQQQFAFILFYRNNDAATGSMHQTLQSTLAAREDAAIVPVQVGNQNEQGLIAKFDATRLPLPAVAVLAPNGAVTSVFPQRVAAQQLTAAIVPTAQAECLKALQSQKIVLLCVQPEGNSSIPEGVKAFQADALFENRTQVVSVRANDPAEAQFLRQLQMRTDQPAAQVAFMAPPGVMLGRYNANVTLDVLAQRLAAAGKCCDDPHCKHHRPSSN